MMKRSVTIIATLAVLALGSILPACNTTKGFGADVEKAGASMKNSAEKNGAD
jgi:predicted small secreted protein